MNYALEVFFNIVSGFVASDFILGFNGKKWLDKKSYWLLPLVYGLVLQILNLTVKAGFIETGITLITLYGISLYVNFDNKIKAVYMIGLFYATLLVVNMTVISVVCKLLNVDGGYLLTQNYAIKYIMIVIIKLMLFVVLRIYLVIYNIKGNMNKGEGLIFVLFPVVTILIILPILELVYYSNFDKKYYIYLFAPVIGLLVLNIVIYFFYNYRIRNIEIENDLKQQVIQDRNEIKNLKLYKESMTIAKKIKHDIKNHLLIVSGFINDNKAEKAKNYIKEIECNLDNICSYIALDDQVINYIVNSKIETAKNKGINVSVVADNNISLPDISEYELCAILGNILDNAVENTKPFGDIIINIEKKNGYFNFLVKNSTDDLNNIDFVTTKPDKENHGMGLSIVSENINKYNGILDIHKDKNMFCVSAYLPCQNKY